jgi:hypothetical protein
VPPERDCANLHFMRSLLFLVLFALPVGAQELVYRSPQGVGFTVTKNGLSAIDFNGRSVARGEWGLFRGDDWFKEFKDGPKTKLDPSSERTLTIINERQARVRQVRGDVVCLSDYSFDGEDVTITSRIENNSEIPLNVPAFSGLTFNFDSAPQGVMNNQHVSYFQAHGVNLCHPGHWSKIGGSYATDKTIGVGVSPAKTGWTRTLILWDYTSWEQNARDKIPSRRLVYFWVNAVPPRGAITSDFKIRVSPNRDWKHLLEPYKTHFQNTFGLVRYKADHRWIATDYLNHSQGAISAQNPYGFHGGARRIDLPEGAKAFADTLVSALQNNGGQGALVWGQGGDDPRGVMYRPDFDILPPEVEKNWPDILARFKNANLRFGVTTRPRDIAVRHDWKSDTSIFINPDDPTHFQMLWNRFDKMLKSGCTLFYLDSFGSDLDDVKLMKRLREKLGPDVLTFAEHQCDAMLPFSGGYSETTLRVPKEGAPEYVLWSGLQNWEIYRYLTPGAQMAARLYQIEGGKIPPAIEAPEAWFSRHNITLLLPVSDFSRLAAAKAAAEKTTKNAP